MTDNLLISKLKNDTQTCLLKKFRSSNSFLNQFLVRKAKAHQNEMIATTYLVSYEGKVVAFFSLLCDSLIMSKSLIEKCKTGKRYKTYPPRLYILFSKLTNIMISIPLNRVDH